MPAHDPAERALISAIAAYTRWSRESPAENAARGQAGLLERFRREALAADPTLAEPELSRRAEAARRAHMRRLVLARHRRARATAADGHAAPGGDAA